MPAPWNNPSHQSLSDGRQRSSAEVLKQQLISLVHIVKTILKRAAGLQKFVFIYLCHVRPIVLSHTSRPCTGPREWVSQPSSLVPASRGLEHEDLVPPGCNDSRLY